jgi:Ulp1 family protease
MHVGNGQVEKENRLTKRSLEKYIPIKIHHTGKSHWVTSLQDKKDGTVYVLDSYSKTFTLTPSLEIQLSAIYGQGKTNLLIKLPEVQQQTNGYDCGVYALVNLVEFCYSGTYKN